MPEGEGQLLEQNSNATSVSIPRKTWYFCELHKVSKTSVELGLLKGTCPPLQSVGTTLEDIDTCSFMDYEVLSQSSCRVCNATVV